MVTDIGNDAHDSILLLGEDRSYTMVADVCANLNWCRWIKLAKYRRCCQQVGECVESVGLYALLQEYNALFEMVDQWPAISARFSTNRR